MKVLDKKFGPLSGRAWTLVVNLIGNIVAIYGVSKILSAGIGWVALTIGISISVVAIIFASIPSRS